MHKLKSILFIPMLLLAACDDVLDQKPVDGLASQDAYTETGTIESAVIGAYNSLWQADYYGFNFLTFAELSTDNARNGSNNGVFLEIDRNATSSENRQLFNFWTSVFTGVNRAMYVISRVPAVANETANPQLTNQYLGEAYFLRALHYHNLVRLFGGMPLVTQTFSGFETDKIYVPRSSVEETYNFILTDLQEAESRLPATYATPIERKGRATRWAAKAMLAKVYLDRGDWQAAASKAAEVIDSGGFALTPAYGDFFVNKNSGESIFEIQFDNQTAAALTNGALASNTLPRGLGGGYTFAPDSSLINAYEPEDTARRSFTIRATGGLPYANKYTRLTTRDDNFIVIRLAELLLIRAEALARLNYPADEALQLVNRVRQRAALRDLTIGDVPDLTAFIDRLYRERRVELAFEGHRRFDLARLASQGNLEAALAGLAITDPNFLLFPIPGYDLDQNPNLTQNPGYPE